MLPRPGRFLAVALLVLTSACASLGGRQHRDNDLMTSEEMLANNFVTVYDAVTALHSNWLNVRPNTLMAAQEDVVVYLDGTRLGGPAELRNINTRAVAYVQHYDPVSAQQRYGVGHSQGVIFVSTHSR